MNRQKKIKEKGTQYRWVKIENQVMDLNPMISIFTLSVNGVNTLNKGRDYQIV